MSSRSAQRRLLMFLVVALPWGCGPRLPAAAAKSGPGHAVGDAGEEGHAGTSAHPRHARDLDAYIAAMLEPGRDEWQMPDRVVATLDLRPGQVVADLGAGPGYFTFRLARAVLPGGKVYAVDIERGMLEALERRREEAGLSASEVLSIWATESDAGLPVDSVDLVLIVDTYHHFGDRPVYMRRLAEVLRPGGRVAVVDFVKKELPFGPPPERKLTRAELVAEMLEAGYREVASHTFLPYQYFVVFAVADDG